MSGRAVRRAPNALVVVVGVILLIALAWAGFGGLSTLSQPPNLKARLDRIDQVADRIGRIPHEAGDPSAYLPHALCTSALSQTGQSLDSQLRGAAAAAGLATPQVAVFPPDAAELDGRATPVTFQLEASGAYESVLGLLRELASNEPQVFADTLDMKTQTSVVSIKLTGRVLCQPPPQ
jgi:hypothetical protein